MIFARNPPRGRAYTMAAYFLILVIWWFPLRASERGDLEVAAACAVRMVTRHPACSYLS